MHIGNARIAVINYLFCRKNKTGKFLLRIDDTDVLRSERKYEAAILDDLVWLGIPYDEFFRQSERLGRYTEVMNQLIQDGFLYKCFETPEELEYKRRIAISKGKAPVYDRASLNLMTAEKAALEKNGVAHYWRFKLPNKVISWDDMILGKISYDLNSISDPVIVKADGTFLYTFSSVVDDFDSGITHIIRGQDHVTNTAVQIAMSDVISCSKFQVNFAHISLFINKDGSQFSKRLGSINLGDIRKSGIDPMSIVDLLATLGTSLDTIPLLRMDDLIDYFDITKFSSNSPKFDIEDISKLNRKIIKSRNYDEVKEKIGSEFMMSESEFLIIKDNVETYNDFIEWQQIMSNGFVPDVSLSPQEKEVLKILVEIIGEGEDSILEKVAERTKLSGKNLYLPIRLALTGRPIGPHIQQLMDSLGEAEVLKRLSKCMS
jgi:glutamyl-tRNA synthetase